MQTEKLHRREAGEKAVLALVWLFEAKCGDINMAASIDVCHVPGCLRHCPRGGLEGFMETLLMAVGVCSSVKAASEGGV